MKHLGAVHIRQGARNRVLATLFLVLALIATACGGGDDIAASDETDTATSTSTDTETPDEAETDEGTGTSTDGTDGEGEADAALEPGTYAVGFESLTSGPAAFAGVPLAQGARLALQEANENAALGEGVELELNERDAGGDPAAAISAVQSMTDEGVAGILCCALSSVAGSIKPILAEAGTAGIVTSAILPGLPEPPYMYRPVLLLAEAAYGPLIEEVVSSGDIQTAAIGTTSDNDGMVEEGDLFRQALEDNGVEVLQTIETSTGDTDFAGPATQVIDLDPDLFVASMLGNEATLMIKALRDRGYEGEIVTTYGVSNENNYEVGGDALAGTKLAIAFTPEAEIPEAQRFTDLYSAEYGEEPDVFSAQGYEAMRLLIEGLRRAGSGDPAAVAEALAGVEEMDTVYGPVVYENGQARLAGDPIFVEWQEGGSLELWP